MDSAGCKISWTVPGDLAETCAITARVYPHSKVQPHFAISEMKKSYRLPQDAPQATDPQSSSENEYRECTAPRCSRLAVL